MATIPWTWTTNSNTPGNPIHTVAWVLASGGADDVGQAFYSAWLNDKCVQLIGTLGTFLLQGTNEETPVNWSTLNDANGNPINETGGARIEQILENPKWIRPNVSGTGTDVTVLLVGRLPKV